MKSFWSDTTLRIASCFVCLLIGYYLGKAAERQEKALSLEGIKLFQTLDADSGKVLRWVDAGADCANTFIKPPENSAIITQQSSGNCSPNVIGGGNVVTVSGEECKAKKEDQSKKR